MPVPRGHLAGLSPRFHVRAVTDKHGDITGTAQPWGLTVSPTAVRVTVVCPLTLGTSCQGPGGGEGASLLHSLPSGFVTKCRARGGSGTSRCTSTFGPPGSAASVRAGLPNHPGTTWNGNPFVRAPRARSRPVPAGGARLRYRRRALGPGTGRRRSAPGARPAAPVPGPTGNGSTAARARTGAAERGEGSPRAGLGRCCSAGTKQPKRTAGAWRGEGANPV